MEIYIEPHYIYMDVVENKFPDLHQFYINLDSYTNENGLLKDFTMILKEIIIWSNFSRKFNDCSHCKYIRTCTGGCRANAYYNGDIEGKDPNCKVYSNFLQVIEN